MSDIAVPNAKELRALRLYVSTDETRPSLSHLWVYQSDGGSTYVATDGYTMCVRRAAIHLDMEFRDIAALEPHAVGEKGDVIPTSEPPPWHQMLTKPDGGKLASAYGFNPAYVARVGHVEMAVGARRADDYIPRPRESKKDTAKKRSDLRNGSIARWSVPSNPLHGWYWTILGDNIRWEGIIMPRRV